MQPNSPSPLTPATPPVSVSVMTPPNAQTIPVPISSQSVEYARVRVRFVAALIDGIILGIISSIFGTLSALVGTGSDTVVATTMVINLLMNLMNMAYFILFTGLKGQTPGKMLMKIKVVKSDSLEIPGILSAFLREIVGKFVSSIVLGIGYIVAIKDPKKQTWHDKIANTVVIKV